MQSNFIRKGNFDTFYAVLAEAAKKKKKTNFILNFMIENFIYLKFLFDKVDEIFVFVEKLEYLSTIYKTVKIHDARNKKQVEKLLDEFWISFEKYVKKSDNSLQFIYKGYNGTDSTSSFGNLDTILQENNSVMHIHQLKHELSIVEGLDFFILVPKFNMVLTVQKVDKEKFHTCYFYNEDLYKNAKNIFSLFLSMSNEKSLNGEADGK